MPAAGKSGARRAAKATTKAPRGASTRSKATAKKAAPKASTPAKASRGAKRTAPKATAPKKVAKKAPPKKVVATKTAPKKAAPKKSVAKKVAPKKQPAAPVAKAAVKSVPAPAPVKKRGKKTVICELSGFEVTPSRANLSPKTLERLKRRLLDERERLLRQSEELAAEAEQLARDRDGGDTQFDEESGEGDTVNVERERDLLLSASARQDVEDIDEALVRMRRGTYGVCRYAGRKLPLERLELLPWADVCVDCKARAERRR
jgi:RNA polymerase-binding transcription factor DksA